MSTPYAAWIATHVRGDVTRQCERWTRRMHKVFPELHRMYGLVMRTDVTPAEGAEDAAGHWWLVEPQGGIVDPTLRQFPWPVAYIPVAYMTTQGTLESFYAIPEQGATLEACARDTAFTANTYGLTGAMHSCAVQVLSDCWVHGDTLKQFWSQEGA